MCSRTCTIGNDVVVCGRLVAHNLPVGVPGNSLLQSCSRLSQIDPAVLKEGSGPLHFRPTHDYGSCRIIHQLADPAGPTSSTDHYTVSKQGRKSPVGETAISIYLYPEGGHACSDTRTGGDATMLEQPNLHIQMIRDSNEPARNTLARMSLSLSKKMGKTSNRSPKTKKDGTTTVTTTTPIVWVVNPTNGNGLAGRLDLQPSMTSRTFWNLASSMSLVIELPLLHGRTTVFLLVEGCPPSISSVRTFEDFGACLFPHVPICVDVGLLCATHCRFDWYVGGSWRKSQTVRGGGTSTDTVDGSLTAGDCYTPDESDLDHVIEILLTPMRMNVTADNVYVVGQSNHSGDGCQEAFRFRRTVQRLPENTILKLRLGFLQDLKQKDAVRILTYNILSDQNQTSKNQMHLYPYVCREVLARQRRMPLILHEIMSYRADVLCLQEVDQIVFEGLFHPVLRQCNYQGYFTGKEEKHEGSALFWSLERFERVPEDRCSSTLLRTLVPHYCSGSSRPDTDGSDGMGQCESTESGIACLLEARPDLRGVLENVLGHVLQLVYLKLVDDDQPNRALWIANTHLYFHANASHIRLLQMYLICRWLMSTQGPKDLPGALVLCGDLNSSLDNAAGKLVVDRCIPGDFCDLQSHLDKFQWAPNGDIGANASVSFPDIRLPNLFPRMHSALLVPPPLFTHYIDGFCGALDHILIQSNVLQTVRQAPMPAVEDVTVDTAMPSPNLPSDHVSLVCDLEYIQALESPN
jgi:mRNA deadenylase 3'-5' endonuclease subunit Ccr4